VLFRSLDALKLGSLTVWFPSCLEVDAAREIYSWPLIDGNALFLSV